MSDLIYIGPYRQQDYSGLVSQLHIKSLIAWTKNSDNKHKLFLRPAYIDMQHISPSIDIEFTKHEILPSRIADCCVIQHLPIRNIAIQHKTTNIIIPILDPNVHKYANLGHIQKLNHADHIIVASDDEKNVLLKSGINTKCWVCDTSYIDFINRESLQKQYHLYNTDLGSRKIFGFIGPYKNNIDTIKTIIHAFLLSLRTQLLANHKKYGLCFFLRGTQKDKSEIEKYYHELITQLGMSHIDIDDMKFIFGYLDSDSCFAALNSIDCLISVNQDINYSLFEKYMKQNQKNIISRQNLGLSTMLALGPPYDHEDVVTIIGIHNVTEKISEYMQKNEQNSKNKKQSKPQTTLRDILCKIVA